VTASNWQAYINAGLSFVKVGNFVFYDSILTHPVLKGISGLEFENTGWAKTKTVLTSLVEMTKEIRKELNIT